MNRPRFFLEAEMIALEKIVAALKPLSPAARIRVIKTCQVAVEAGAKEAGEVHANGNFACCAHSVVHGDSGEFADMMGRCCLCDVATPTPKETSGADPT